MIRPASRAGAGAILALSALSPAPLSAQQTDYHAALEAAADPAISTLPDGVMLAIPGLLEDFAIAGGGQLVELPNGTARLTARVFSMASLYSAFVVDIEFGGRVQPNDPNYPPVGSPNAQLAPSAYAPLGPVDPSTFVYYTTATGKLVGTHNYDGAVIDLQLGALAAQRGAGANNCSAVLGLEAELTAAIARWPTPLWPQVATASLRCDLPLHRADKATHPEVDPTRSTWPDRALSLPGIGDYVFAPAGEFTEFEDGHAELSGTLRRLAQLDDAWQLTLQLTQRVDPGEANHPPVGSPVLLMQPGAYANLGGTVDPAHWHYYETATGALVGDGLNDGGRIDLTQLGAVQFGSGANQGNTFLGFHGELAGVVSTQPTGRSIALTGDVDLSGVTERIPVMPFPVLTPPTTQYTLPTLTEQGLVLQGDNFAWVEFVAVGSSIIARGDESRWRSGWIRVLDNQQLELHTPQGLEAAVYELRAVNPAVVSNLLFLSLTTPTAPTLRAEASVTAPGPAHFLMHRGPSPNPALTVLAASFHNSPTVFPGYASLQIGAGGTDLTVLPLSFFHDPVTGIAQWDMGPIPSWFSGFTMHFQAATLDLVTQQLPMTATNVWSVAF